MRKQLLALALLLAAAPAQAQPCDVQIAYAPDDVRAEIEKWVRAEPRCANSLEVRAVRTAEGLYLFARDGRGFTRDRVVPDAEAAGALVVSWAADDTVDGLWIPGAPGTPDRVAVPGTPMATRTPMPAPSPYAGSAAPVAAPERTPARTGSPGRTLRIAGLVAGAIGLVEIATSVYFGFKAREVADRIQSQPQEEPWPSDIEVIVDRGMRYERLQLGFLAAGGVLIAGGAAMYLVGRVQGRAERTTIAPVVAPGSVGVSLGKSF